MKDEWICWSDLLDEEKPKCVKCDKEDCLGCPEIKELDDESKTLNKLYK